MIDAPAMRKPMLARAGMVLLAVALFFVGAFGAVRFALELAVSPVHYLIEDAGFALLGLAGCVACYRTSRRWRALEVEAVHAEASRLAIFTGSYFEARIGLARVLAMWVFVLLLGGFSVFFIAANLAAGRLLSVGTLILFAASLSFVWLGWSAWRVRPGQQPTLLMDSSRLVHCIAGEVRWADVVGLQLLTRTYRGVTSHILALGVNRTGAVRQTGLAKWLAPSRTGLQIPLKGLNRSPEQVLAAALHFRDMTPPPRLQFWYPGMSAEAVQLGFSNQELMRHLETVIASPDALEPRNILASEAVTVDLLGQMDALRPQVQAQAASRLRQLKWMAWGLGAVTVVAVVAAVARIATTIAQH